MKAMILAAGRGGRLKPLTDHTPKPLLMVGGKPLIVYHLIALAKAGIKEVVINISYLAQQMRSALGDGHQYGVNITYSFEPQVLETGGGIMQALPLLGDEPFMVVSADIWTDYPLASLAKKLTHQAHLVMVDNPSFHPRGDFAIDHGMLSEQGETKLTFASFGIYHPDLFKTYPATQKIFPLVDVLRYGLARQQISAEHYTGEWDNIGTLAQLQRLDAYIKNHQS